MVFFQAAGAALSVIALFLLFDLSAERITDDLIAVIAPDDTLAEKASGLRGGKNRHALYRKLTGMKTALEATGRSKQFTVICCASLALFAGGVVLGILIGNVFLIPALSAGLALIPFFCASAAISSFEKQTGEELETALSIISSSYIRSDDILSAVRENIPNIRPPLRKVFEAFEGEATAVSSSIKRALFSLRGRVDDTVFREWCDTLIQCQDDRTMKDTLLPVAAKLTDVRVVNGELKTMLASARNEYWVMAGLVAGNVPLLYLLNRDWFHTLLYTTGGKAVCGVCAFVILVTALLMMKYTKPVEYEG